MNEVRKALKIACRAVLATGLAGAAVIALLTLRDGAPADLPLRLATALLSAGGLVVTVVFATGVVRLLVSIDERLEQLLNQTGGQ